jgi:hypothetical protein
MGFYVECGTLAAAVFVEHAHGTVAFSENQSGSKRAALHIKNKLPKMAS